MKLLGNVLAVELQPDYEFDRKTSHLIKAVYAEKRVGYEAAKIKFIGSQVKDYLRNLLKPGTIVGVKTFVGALRIEHKGKTLRLYKPQDIHFVVTD